MKWAVIKGKDLVRFEEHDAQREIPPGSKRYPVVIQQKPDHDPSTQYLDSYWQLSDDGSCVGILYTVHDSPPKAPPPPFGDAPPVIVERVVERIVDSSADVQVRALELKLAEMQAAQRISELILLIQQGTDEAQISAFREIEPLAAARGMAVADYVREWIVNRDRQSERALDLLKGAA